MTTIPLISLSTLQIEDNHELNSLQAVEHMEKLKSQKVEPPPEIHGEFPSRPFT